MCGEGGGKDRVWGTDGVIPDGLGAVIRFLWEELSTCS